MGKEEARSKKRQVTNFNETECSSSAVVGWAVQQQNDVDEGSIQGNWDSQEGKYPV